MDYTERLWLSLYQDRSPLFVNNFGTNRKNNDESEQIVESWIVILITKNSR